MTINLRNTLAAADSLSAIASLMVGAYLSSGDATPSTMVEQAPESALSAQRSPTRASTSTATSESPGISDLGAPEVNDTREPHTPGGTPEAMDSALEEAQAQAQAWQELNRLEAAEAIRSFADSPGSSREARIEALLAVDIPSSPNLVAPVLESLAPLARNSPKRDDVARQLARRVESEAVRVGARESLGNVILLLEALEEIGSPAVTRALCDNLKSLDDAVLQDAVVRALARTGDASAKSCLSRFLADLEAGHTPAREPEALAYALENTRSALVAVSR